MVDLLQLNPDAAWFVGGLALLTTAGILVLTRRAANDDRFWFAGFALGQSLCAAIAIVGARPGLPQTTIYRVFQLVLLIASLEALLEYARRARQSPGHLFTRPWIHLPPLLITALGLLGGSARTVATSALLAIGLPAGCFAAMQYYHRARRAGGLRRLAPALIALGLTALVLAQLSSAPIVFGVAALMLVCGVWLDALTVLDAGTRWDRLLRRPLPAAFSLLALLGCWFFSAVGAGQSPEELAVVEVESDVAVSSWDESMQRWRAAWPFLAITIGLPAVGAGVYWLRGSRD